MQGKNIFMDSDRGSAKNVAEKSAQSVEPLSTIPWAQTFCMTLAAVRIVHASQSTAGAAIQIVNITGNGIGTNKLKVIQPDKVIMYFDLRENTV